MSPDAPSPSAELVDRIRALEPLSRVLAPDAPDRARARSAVVEYAEGFYARLDRAKGYEIRKDAASLIHQHPLGEEGTDLDTLLDLVGRAVDTPGINTASPAHMGYIPGGGVYASALGDYLAAVTNRYAGVRFASPGGVAMEEEVLAWMARLVGFGDGWGGNLTSGGSVANLIGVVTAREAHGLKAADYERAVVYSTSHVHHCVDKALRVAGMAEAVRRQVPMDRRYRMDPEALAAAVEADRQAGLKPWMVVASAGTTDVGAVDPLAEVGRVAGEQGLWYHVDAAYGGFFALCPDTAPLLEGMALADSVVLDPHKGLFLPFGSGAVLVKDKAAMYRAHGYEAHYMQDTLPEQTLALASPGDLSPEFSKHFRGPRLWLPLMLHGVAPFRTCLEEKLLLTRYFHQEVQELGFQVGPEPELSVATYRWMPESGDPDAFNERLMAALHQDGRIFVSSTRIQGHFVLRAAILSYRTRLEHVQQLLELLEEKVGELEAGV